MIAGGDEEEMDSESFTAVSVGCGQDFETLKYGDDMFAGDPLARDFSVSVPVSLG